MKNIFRLIRLTRLTPMAAFVALGCLAAFQLNAGGSNVRGIAIAKSTVQSSHLTPLAQAVDRPRPKDLRKRELRQASSNRHLLIGYWQTFVNNAAIIPLSQVSGQYDVINVAFGMPAPGTAATISLSIDPSIESMDQFTSDIAGLHGRGKIVLLSIGGASAPIKLDTERKVKKFVKSVTTLVHQYSFDGIDIDFEGNSVKLGPGDTDFKSPTTPAIVNLISALHTIKHTFGAGFKISFAPSTFSLQGGFSNYGGEQGSYLPVIYGTRDILSWVQTQDYDSGTMFGLDGNIYTGGTADFHVAMTEFLLNGFAVAHNSSQIFPPLEQSQVAFGVPASIQAASTTPPSFATPTDVQNSLNYLINGVPYSGHQYTLLNPAGYHGMLGVMTWSINWDVTNLSAMSNQLGPFLHAQSY